MHQNKTQVETARHGKVGVVVDLKRNELPLGAEVYLITGSDEPEETREK